MESTGGAQKVVATTQKSGGGGMGENGGLGKGDPMPVAENAPSWVVNSVVQSAGESSMREQGLASEGLEAQHMEMQLQRQHMDMDFAMPGDNLALQGFPAMGFAMDVTGADGMGGVVKSEVDEQQTVFDQQQFVEWQLRQQQQLLYEQQQLMEQQRQQPQQLQLQVPNQSVDDTYNAYLHRLANMQDTGRSSLGQRFADMGQLAYDVALPRPEGEMTPVVAMIAGPREAIYVRGGPVNFCPRCAQEGRFGVIWTPHQHGNEPRIRYICSQNFDDFESIHHVDIPHCFLCGTVFYLFEFNHPIGTGANRRQHKYILRCVNGHILPLLDLWCQAKKSGTVCGATFKLQWTYNTVVQRCDTQKNRDHDLWWVRYKTEWKQRRTMIRYKKDFLAYVPDHLRAMLLGIGMEGEYPPDVRGVLGFRVYSGIARTVQLSYTKVERRKKSTRQNPYLPQSQIAAPLMLDDEPTASPEFSAQIHQSIIAARDAIFMQRQQLERRTQEVESDRRDGCREMGGEGSASSSSPGQPLHLQQLQDRHYNDMLGDHRSQHDHQLQHRPLLGHHQQHNLHH